MRDRGLALMRSVGIALQPRQFTFLRIKLWTGRMPGKKRTIAILTGGGDVPGLNPAIRAITIRALREGYRVVGIRRGWARRVDYAREPKADNAENVQVLSEAIVNRAGRTGGTFLHTSRTRPSHLPRERLPQQLAGY